MINEISISAWCWMLAAVLVSSGAGLALSRLVPWSDAARNAGVPRAFAFALAPFLLGLMAVVALGVFRGASHALHIGVVFAGLLALCAAAIFSRPDNRPAPPSTHQPKTLWGWIFCVILTIWVLALVVNTSLLPLLQNDSLEYAIVGRLLFESRDLLSYPAISPDMTSSGFFGPWTHPPLYCALIYVTNAFQGYADAPGLMRVISPWFALTATVLVYSLGCMVNRAIGCLTALLLLSSPLFFLGAGAALIDTLPVLGSALVLSSVIGMEGSPVRRGTFQGLTLGIAMWTHSQAVLFIPLAVTAIFLTAGFRNLRALAHQLTVVIGVACLLAAWPYARNLGLFGSLISDNPAVFAMDNLNWPEYFSLKRGLFSWPEKIQYGILKGWFAVEAYGLSFWFMTLGIAGSLAMRSRPQAGTQSLPGGWTADCKRLATVASGMVFLYLSGTVISVLLGIDLMIRNERYLLAVLPAVAILAAVGIHWVTAAGASSRRAGTAVRLSLGLLTRGAMHAFILFLFLIQLAVIGGFQWVTTGCSGVPIESCPETMLRKAPSYRAAEFMRDQLPADATVLSMKPADMYYAGRRMLSYLDPRLIPFYGETNTERAWQMLREMGVSHLHIPDYSLPPLYNSALQEMTGRPELTRLLFSSGGYQVYALNEGKRTDCRNSFNVSPGVIPWTQARQFTPGGRKNLLRLTLSTKAMDSSGISSPEPGLPLFRRERTTMLLTDVVEIPGRRLGHNSVGKSEADEFGLDLVLEGQALAQIHLMQYDAAGRLLEESLLGEMTLGRQHPKRRFIKRFFARYDSAALRLGVEHRGDSLLGVRHAALIVF